MEQQTNNWRYKILIVLMLVCPINAIALNLFVIECIDSCNMVKGYSFAEFDTAYNIPKKTISIPYSYAMENLFDGSIFATKEDAKFMPLKDIIYKIYIIKNDNVNIVYGNMEMLSNGQKVSREFVDKLYQFTQFYPISQSTIKRKIIKAKIDVISEKIFFPRAISPIEFQYSFSPQKLTKIILDESKLMQLQQTLLSCEKSERGIIDARFQITLYFDDMSSCLISGNRDWFVIENQLYQTSTELNRYIQNLWCRR